jgi:dipeptidyl aminopeptidase/acylaminoacyl peptidase
MPRSERLAPVLATAALLLAGCGSVSIEQATVVETAPRPAAVTAPQPTPAPAPAPATPQPAPEPPATPAPAPTAASVPKYTIEQFLDTVTLGGASFSPDKSKILVSTDESGIFNAYAVTTQGAQRTPLTRSTTDSIYAFGYFPNDERFLYGSDKGGDENTHVYVRELDGSVRDLTPGDKLKANFLQWSHDKKSFFLSTNERDPRFFDIYELATDGYERKLIYQDEKGLTVAAISPDRRYLAFVQTGSNSDSDVLLFDTRGKAFKNITEHPGFEVANSPQTFSPTSTSLYYTSDRDREFAALMRYDIVTGEHLEVLRPDWDVAFAYFSETNRYLVVGINNDARTEIRLFDAKTMQPAPLPRLPEADISSITFSNDDTLMALYADTSRSPRNLFVYELATGKLSQLTQTLNPAIDPANLVEGKVVRFPSYDGVQIPGLLYVPQGARPGSTLPALVWVHGGPGGQSRLGYSALTQYLVNHGYVVYAINNRGSSGYGKTFYKMDDRKHGDADLGDCIASKKMLTGLGVVDPGRIGIIGGSYGGYMVLAALAFRPQEFTAGVDLFGVSNWVRTLESVPPYWESFRLALYKELGDPATDLEYLRKISPLFHADKIERPLMVLQGANDPRVLQVESDEIVAAAKKRGTTVEYIVFPDEGHGFVKKANQVKGYKAVLDFLDQHLRGGGGTKAAP